MVVVLQREEGFKNLEFRGQGMKNKMYKEVSFGQI